MNNKWLFPVIALIALIFLFSCGAPAAVPSPTGTATGPAPGPKYGGTLRLSFSTNPNAIDPIMVYQPQPMAWARLYLAAPVRWKGRDDSEAQIIPWIFKSWETSADGLVITAKMEEGVKYQNLPPVNGRELTSADFKFAQERIMDVKNRSPLRPYMVQIDRIETPDKYTVRIVNKEPYPSGVLDWGSGSCGFIAREVIEQDGNGNKTWVGPGPFIFKEFAANQKAVFVKNPDYYEKSKPYLDRIELYYVPDEAQRVAAFRAKEIDSVLVSKSTADNIKSTNPDAVITPKLDTRGSAIYFGMVKYPKPWADVRVRKAVAHAIDYDGLIAAALDGAAYRSDFLGPMYKDWGARTGKDLIQHDVAKAKALLAEAGYPSGFKTSLIINKESNEMFRMAEPIVAMLKDVAINCTIIPQDTATFQSVNKTGEFELCVGGSQIEKPEVDACLQPVYWSQGTQNFSKYVNPRVDELFTLQRKAAGNVELRKSYVKEILSILDKDWPSVPLNIRYLFSVEQPYLKGWNNRGDGNTMFGYSDLVNAWIDK